MRFPLCNASHPVWVRGLKHSVNQNKRYFGDVAPRVGAWIETENNRNKRIRRDKSHPVWVRGLKQLLFGVGANGRVVAPRVGAWIETLVYHGLHLIKRVAPRVGAWIETNAQSFATSFVCGRTPCGCVD